MNGQYRQFVTNRVSKIQANSKIKLHDVPRTKNPADLGSRREQLTEHWLQAPAWLGANTKRPESERGDLECLLEKYSSYVTAGTRG